MTTSEKYVAMARETDWGHVDDKEFNKYKNIYHHRCKLCGPYHSAEGPLNCSTGVCSVKFARALERAALEGAIEQLEWAISVIPSKAEHYLRDNLIILRTRLTTLDKAAKEK